MKNNPTTPSGHVGSSDLLGGLRQLRVGEEIRALDLIHVSFDGLRRIKEVRRGMASASTEFPHETARAVFYQRARYHHAARAGVDFFLLEGLSTAATETAFKSLSAGSSGL